MNANTSLLALAQQGASVSQDPLLQTHINNAFGPGSPILPVLGTREGLTKLKSAIEQTGLSILPDSRPNVNTFPTGAVAHLQAAGNFPRSDVLRQMRDGNRYTINASINSVPNVTLSPDVPPLQGLNLRRFLGFLRAADIFHEDDMMEMYDMAEGERYELGLLTAVFEGGRFWKARLQIIPCYRDTAATHTIWLYRSCTRDETGEITERWHSIGRPRRGNSQPPPDDSNDDDNSGGGDVTNKGATRVSRPRKKRIVPKRTQRNQIDLSNASAETILNGNPDNVVQEEMLRVAEVYSNNDIFKRLRARQRALGRSQLVSLNTVTRRITVALEKVAPRKKTTKEALRSALNREREANGVPYRKQTKLTEQNGTETNPANSTMTMPPLTGRARPVMGSSGDPGEEEGDDEGNFEKENEGDDEDEDEIEDEEAEAEDEGELEDSERDAEWVSDDGAW